MEWFCILAALGQSAAFLINQIRLQGQSPLWWSLFATEEANVPNFIFFQSYFVAESSIDFGVTIWVGLSEFSPDFPQKNVEQHKLQAMDFWYIRIFLEAYKQTKLPKNWLSGLLPVMILLMFSTNREKVKGENESHKK